MAVAGQAWLVFNLLQTTLCEQWRNEKEYTHHFTILAGMGLKKRSRHLQSQAFSKIGLNVNVNKKKYVKGSRTLSGRQWKWGNLKKKPIMASFIFIFHPYVLETGYFQHQRTGKILTKRISLEEQKGRKIPLLWGARRTQEFLILLLNVWWQGMGE